MLSRRPQERNSPKICGTHLLPRWPQDGASGRRTHAAARGRSRARRLDRRATSLIRARRAGRNRVRPFAGQLREPTRELGRMPRRANKMRRRFRVTVSRPHWDQRVRPGYDLSSSFETRAIACIRPRVQPIAVARCRREIRKRATSRTARCRPEGHVSRSCRRGCCRCVATLADELPPRHLRRAAMRCGIGRSCCAT